jgi:glyoxylase-like metal-dependent hydrolase (beta-lactamase superfamily II)
MRRVITLPHEYDPQVQSFLQQACFGNANWTSRPRRLEVGSNDVHPDIGAKDAVLVDAQLTSDALYELLDWVVASGHNITHVYVTHAYGDHFFGSVLILERFLDMGLVAVPEVVAKMKLETMPERLTGLWEKLFPNQILQTLKIA